MQIQYCTITGADDRTLPHEMAEMTEKYPFVEWGILIYPKKMGTPRYPLLQSIDEFVAVRQECPVHLAAHLCGTAVDQFLTGNPVSRTMLAPFDRIQVNVDPTMMAVNRMGMVLRYAIRRYSDNKPIITQHNAATAGFYRHIADLDTHAILFDASRGNGVRPSHWPDPFPNKRCGYAGGLNPDTIEEDMAAIDRAAGSATVWIDLETGVRTNDELDMEKVETVLAAASKYA